MSGFVSNSGTVAVLLPIVLGIAVSSNIKPIKLLLPLVIGATIGADITIIGSPGNLIAKNTIEEFSNGKMIADVVVNLTGNAHPLIIMASLWILTWALTQVMSNTAACTLLCPIGWTIAESLGTDPRAVVIAVFVASFYPFY